DRAHRAAAGPHHSPLPGSARRAMRRLRPRRDQAQAHRDRHIASVSSVGGTRRACPERGVASGARYRRNGSAGEGI
ncbi:MAG: hypothetical protein AVDCRST_MAG77-3006, partial [uncultured Chloroflexi bacterium]